MNPQIAYLLNTSIQQIESGRLDDAERTLGQILKIQPKNADALSFLSVVSAYRFDFDQALIHISKAIECDPKNSNALSNKGNIFKELGRLDEAESAYKKAILLDSKNPEAFNNLGNLQQDLGHYSEAIENYEKAIKLVPNYAEAYSNKGNALEKLGDYSQSLGMYEKAINLRGDFYDAWLNRGVVLNKLKRFHDALDSYDQAININPLSPLAWTVKGSSLSANGFSRESIKYFNKAISLNAEFAEAWASKGSALAQLKEYEEALLSFKRAFSINDELGYALGDVINIKQQIAAWDDLSDDLFKMLKGVSNNAGVIHPFKYCSVIDSPAGALSTAKKWTTTKFPSQHLLPDIKKADHKKIRIGYFSADFKNHPVALLLAELIELHDRDQFEIYAFSLKGAEKDDETRLRLSLAFDKFLNLEIKTEVEIAQIARDLEIDIAVDLGGHTEFAPTGIMAYRAAPIQVNYLGYPGTMGAGYMDYIVADPTLIPAESRQFYSEKVVYLPDTYMVDDSMRLPSGKVFTRQECGLPEIGFVFCCFNNGYKFNEKTLQSWSNILTSTTNSVLWVSENNEAFRKNLLLEFIKRGIDNDRIIFAKRLASMADHLARLSMADLFLDTHPFNAHTTAVDALKAGVPVLTYIGQAFAGRVAASVLNAVGLPELVTNSLDEYEKIAIEISLNPDKLLLLKIKLAENRKKKALFNTPRFVKNIESAYIEMYKKYSTEMPADHIYVEAR
jgi:predicted O-linked N-acetylglucosamine transferase (SPINDLY family)